MRFAAIADIHGNSAALAAVLADIRKLGLEDIVNLGDVFSGPLDAAATATLLAPLDLPTIAGNHDRWLATLDPADMAPSDLTAFGQLPPDSIDWLKALPPTLVYADRVLMCHGTPDDDLTTLLDAITPEAHIVLREHDDIASRLSGVPQDLILCGHTHIARSVRLADGRQIVNPGSVGCPAYADDTPFDCVWQTGAPQACYAILEDGDAGWDVTFRLVPYDSAPMAALARERGRPTWTRALDTGWGRFTLT